MNSGEPADPIAAPTTFDSAPRAWHQGRRGASMNRPRHPGGVRAGRQRWTAAQSRRQQPSHDEQSSSSMPPSLPLIAYGTRRSALDSDQRAATPSTTSPQPTTEWTPELENASYSRSPAEPGRRPAPPPGRFRLGRRVSAPTDSLTTCARVDGSGRPRDRVASARRSSRASVCGATAGALASRRQRKPRLWNSIATAPLLPFRRQE
jgi:hypothetical protein